MACSLRKNELLKLRNNENLKLIADFVYKLVSDEFLSVTQVLEFNKRFIDYIKTLTQVKPPGFEISFNNSIRTECK